MEAQTPKINIDKYMQNALDRKITLYCRVMGIAMIISNAFIFSPFSTKENVGGALGIGLIFLLNPIATCIAGRSMGLKNRWLTANGFFCSLIASVYLGGYAFKYLFEMLGVEFKNSVVEEMPIQYGIFLLILFVVFAQLGAISRKRLKDLVDDAVEKVKLAKLKEYAEKEAKRIKKKK